MNYLVHTYLYLVRKTYGNVTKENTFDNDKQKLLPLRHNNTAHSNPFHKTVR